MSQTENSDDSQFTCESSGFFYVYRNRFPVMIEQPKGVGFHVSKLENSGQNKSQLNFLLYQAACWQNWSMKS